MTTDSRRAVRIEHERLSALLIEQLRCGDAPWQRPVQPQSILPYNPQSHRRYRGVNSIALLARSRTDPRWMTTHQALALGGQVRSGERGALIYWWQFVEHRPGREARPLTHPRLATAIVFNAEQIDGLAPTPLPPRQNDAHTRLHQLLYNASAAVSPNASVVQYDSALDSLISPEPARLLTDSAAAGRALHALARWTGHSSRLARDISAPFGSIEAAAEELRAAIYVRLCASEFGLELPRAARTELIDAWVRVLERDPLEIGRAALDAERVQAYLLQPHREHQRARGPETIGSSVDKKSRQYLAVPYADRERARAAGARYDREAKCWYIGPSAVHDTLAQWQPSGRSMVRSSDAREEFAAVLRSLGLKVVGAHPIMDGRRHRLRADGDRGSETAGYYIGRLDGIPNGYAGNYRTGQSTPWSGRSQVHSSEELAELRAQAAQAAAARAEQRRELERAVARRVQARVAQLHPLAEQLPYLERKQIRWTSGAFVVRDATDRDPDWWPFSEWRCRDGTICLPARDANGRLWTMQYIDPDGQKRFEPNGFKRGCFHVIGATDLGAAAAFVIAEGYATAATLNESVHDSRVALVAGFDSGNLPAVAAGLRARFPRVPIVVAGDNDARLMHRPPYKNVGTEKALAAAEAANGVAITPTFPPGSDPERTDFNDLATLGPGHRAAVARQVRSAVELARRQLHGNVDALRHTPKRTVRI